MPVSTSEAAAQLYGGDTDHFTHILDHLFVPAISEAGFTAIPPIAQGADVIQAEIIKNLETADLVLCDISTLNPNVFFELGCRTALNKPVCYVKDDLTLRIPFDTGIINHYTYNSLLAPWILKEEIVDLAKHIVSSAERSGNRNMLWQYFGLRSTAHAAATDSPEASRLEYLVMQVEALRKTLDEQSSQTFFPLSSFGYSATSPGAFPAYYGTIPSTGQPTFSLSTSKDWPKVLSVADRELNEILRVRKHPRTRAGLDEVRFIIDGHIKDLTDLIKESPQGVDIDRARHVLKQFKMLREGKIPDSALG